MSMITQVCDQPANLLGFGERSVWIYLHDAGPSFARVLQKAIPVAAKRRQPGHPDYFTAILLRQIFLAGRSPTKALRSLNGLGVSATERWGDLNVSIDIEREALGERLVSGGKMRPVQRWVTFGDFASAKDPAVLLFGD